MHRRTFLLAGAGGALSYAGPGGDTAAGWRKYEGNPVIGGALGTVFDIAVMKDGNRYRMWASWRMKKSVALFESADGIDWSTPEIVLAPIGNSQWEQDINRPVVVRRGSDYHMWYTGQGPNTTCIGYATSPDGKVWKRMSADPVLAPEAPWEKVALMCPHVIFDQKSKLYRMWYSGGERYEPDAIGYATSRDGIHWERYTSNPIFLPDPNAAWEQHKVTACEVVQQGRWHYMFYIGFRDVDHAQIGLARSKDGITGWQRHRANPIIGPGRDQWDQDACYKPYAILDGGRWMLWYNGRREKAEQIGLAMHDGEDLGF